MHDCGKGCGQACDCDVEDTWLEAPDDCTHECEEVDDEQEAGGAEDTRGVGGRGEGGFAGCWWLDARDGAGGGGEPRGGPDPNADETGARACLIICDEA